MPRRKSQTYHCPICGWFGYTSKGMTNQAWCPACLERGIRTDLLDGHRKGKRRSGKAGREVVIEGEARD
ncbi:unnamed protein product [marine sediment metagenome]|uniref:Uncharacterized protein n=1 Tax=marine sediment metagenome TaxID=412755 RepID=X0Y6V1_9ZZZZ